MVIVTISFGDISVKIPFYVIESGSQSCIIGRLSMRILNIQPLLQEKIARIQPKGVKTATVLEFLEPEEFQDLTIITCDTEHEFEHETTVKVTKNTGAVHWDLLDPEDRDNNPNIFQKMLQKDLQDALDSLLIDEDQAEEAHKTISNYQDVFRENPGKYIGGIITLNLIEEDGHKNPWKGEKYHLSKKLLPVMLQAIKVMLALGIVQPSNPNYKKHRYKVNDQSKKCHLAFSSQVQQTPIKRKRGRLRKEEIYVNSAP